MLIILAVLVAPSSPAARPVDNPPIDVLTHAPDVTGHRSFWSHVPLHLSAARQYHAQSTFLGLQVASGMDIDDNWQQVRC